MKIGVIGDLHLTNRGPERRKDDYFQTQMKKLAQALRIFHNNGCAFVVQVGDFFDAPTVANRVKAEVIKTLAQHKRYPVYGIWGQHDVSGHSEATLPNSPLAVLEAALVIELLGKDCVVPKVDDDSQSWSLYGASFGQEVPPVKCVDDFNILVTHRMIGNRPLFPGQELENPRKFLRAHPEYNLILVGDYHYPFQDEYQGRVILNAGCVVRKNLNDVREGLQPKVCVVSLPDLTVQDFPLDCQSVEDVFDLHMDTQVGSDKQSLTRFIERLKNSESAKVGWKSMLLDVIREKNVSESAQTIINEILEECQAK